MNRIKFLVFALAAVGLWGYHVVVSPAAALRSVDQAGGAVAGAGAAVALRIEQQRSELQAATIRLQASPAAWNVGPKAGARAEGPTPERFAAVRTVLAEAVSEASRPNLVVLLVNDQGMLAAQGTAEPGAPPSGFDVGLVVQGGAQGSVASYGPAVYLFYATPLLISDKNEVRVAGTAVAGLPLLPDGKKLEQAARELRLSSLAVLSQNTVKVAAGPEKVLAEQAAKAIRPGQVAPLALGPVRELGPLALPLFVEASPLSMGARQAIAGTPFEVIAVASTREPLEALAAYQLFGLGVLVGLVLLAAGVAVLIKPEDDGGGRMVVPPPMPLPPLKPREDTGPKPIAVAGPHAGPEGDPDAFDFGKPKSPFPESALSAQYALDVVKGAAAAPPASTGTPAPARAEAPPPPGSPRPSSAPTISSVPPFVPGPPVPGARVSPTPQQGVQGVPSEWGEPTASAQAPIAQGVLEPADDPFATAAPEPLPSQAAARAAGPNPPRPSGGARVQAPVPNPFDEPPTQAAPAHGGGPVSDPFANSSDSGENTKVATVPQELMRAARNSGPSLPTPERSAPRATSSALPRVQSVVAPAAATPGPSAPEGEERHYQDVFRDFVATREKCGEPADGLTYERFKTKLLKNRETLLAKYQCRTVRFQVYVKDGKAALKASPVRE